MLRGLAEGIQCCGICCLSGIIKAKQHRHGRMCLWRKCLCVSNNPASSVPLNAAARVWDWSTHLVKLPAPTPVADHRWRRTGALVCSVNLVIIDHHILTELKLPTKHRCWAGGRSSTETCSYKHVVSRSFQVKGEGRRLFQRWVQSQSTFLQILIKISWKEGTLLSN